MTSFKEDFDAYYRTRRDYRCYLEAKGYRTEGDRTVWEPTDPIDVEPEKLFGPGAMVREELDYSEFYQDNDEPDLFFENLDEF